MSNASLPSRSGLPDRSWWITPWMIVSQLITLFTLVGWYAAANASLLAAEASGGVLGNFFVLLLWAYPLFPFLCILLSWALYFRGAKQLAALISGLPLIPPAVFYFWSQVI
ncbi:MAG: hypothetical protein GX495_21155 [Chloroflexi bacterium]|jgi:hypothetical protein|nr:hypothetical protein [Chloroflexota bacterium]